MPSVHGHKHSDSVNQNRKAQLANAYNELGKELSSTKIRVVGNYTLGKVIGEGAYGKVRLGTHRLTSTRVAIKQIPKAMSASLTREIHHHRQLHHPNVTQMYEVIATESSIWIVTELCSGGELFDYLAEKGRLPEDETKIIFGQLCLAVAYLHDNGIVHRDLKLENVLLDERCRVKLGDFGFTREYERGCFMETFCGTTGYASPEMLQGRKYQGPEVDVWSLGIILYCLLTGTLPFDDDDEDIMRQKVIRDDFEDPAWLSLESRDLLQNILQKDVTKRYTIPQILAHPWFTVKELSYEPDTPLSPEHIPRSSSPETSEASTHEHASPFSNNPESSTPTTPDDSVIDPFDSKPHPDFSIHRNASNTTIRRTSLSDISLRLHDTLVEEEDDVPEPAQSATHLRPLSWSNSATPKAPPPSSMIRTPARTKRRSVSSVLSENVLGGPDFESSSKTPAPLPSQLDFASLLTTPMPIIFSTPLERELLNTLSNMGMDTAQIVHSVLSDACDSAGALWWMLKKKAIEKRAAEAEGGVVDTVSTPIEPPRHQQRSASLDPGSGRGSPRRKRTKVNSAVQTDDLGQYLSTRVPPSLSFVPPTPTVMDRPRTPPHPTSPSNRSPMLSPTSSVVNVEQSLRSHPSTPGGSTSSKDGSKGRKNRAGSVSIMQRATTALEAAGLVRKKSTEAVAKDKEEKAHAKEHREREKERERGEPERRGTTSGEESRSSHSQHSHENGSKLSTSSAVVAKLTKSPPVHKLQLKDKDRERDRDRELAPPSTPPPQTLTHSEPGAGGTMVGSPWVLADKEGLAMHSGPSIAAATINARGEMMHSHSAPNLETLDDPVATPTSARTAGAGGGGSSGKGAGLAFRNRANILTSLRLWFNDDRKGKRKPDGREGPASAGVPQRMPVTPQSGHSSRSMGMSFGSGGTAKRRGSNSSAKYANNGTRAGNPGTHRAKRPSMSSRRSSSVNSRRSSVASMQMVSAVSGGLLDSPSQGLRSGFSGAGTHTPNSEWDKGEYVGSASRPSSIHSFSMLSTSAGAGGKQHRKSPSASSSGSLHLRTASPMQRHHRRAGSGGTRVVRQTVVTGGLGKPIHARSNSATSSLYSPPNSRPTSFYEPSDNEGLSGSFGNSGGGGGRNASPLRTRKRSSGERRSGSGSTAFVAQKRSGPLASPAFGSSTVGKSSWKKSWGMEPPGWQSRSALAVPAVEVLAMGPVNSGDPPMLRDVFSGSGGRNSFSQGHGDESDWVDEDDLDIPAFAGGLGQLGIGMGGSSVSGGAGTSSLSSALSSSLGPNFGNLEPIVTLGPAPRGWGAGGSKRGGNASNVGGSSGGGGVGVGSISSRNKPGHSPAERHAPLPSDSSSVSTGRRQLPTARSGPAFKHAIQEEDEDEEEE